MVDTNSPGSLRDAAASDSEAQLRLLLGMQAMWETDADGVVVADSPSWRAYTGQSAKEWLGYGWLDAVHPDDRAYAERQWREAVAALRPVDAEFRLRAPDGGWRWTNVRAVPVLNGQGSIGKWAGLNIDIDDRKRAEAALRESESRFRGLFETMGQAYVLLEVVRDADGAATDVRILELNPSYGRLMGTSVEDARGHCVYQLFPDVDRWWLETCDRVARAGRPDRVEHKYNEGGTWFECWLYPRDGDRIEALFEEITERKRAEDALRTSEEQQAFLLAFDDALRPFADPASVTETANRLLGERLNASRAYYVEWPPGAEYGEVVRDYTVPGLPSLAGRYPTSTFRSTYERVSRGHTWLVENAATDNAISEAERRYYLDVGVAAWVDVPLVKEGQAVAVLCVVQDKARAWTDGEIKLVEEVAERCWATVERARAEAALRESEERLRSFAEASSDVFWIIDANGERLEYLSPAYEAIWGEPRDAVLADIGHWASRVHPDDRMRAGEAMQVLKAGKRHAVEYRVVRPDGSMRYIHNTGFPIVADGKIRRLAGVAQDLTERHQAERALAEAEQRARTLMEGVPQLVWRASGDGGWTWASPQWTAFTGQAEQDTHGFGWLISVHPDDRDKTRAAWDQAIETGELGVEYRLRSRDGAYSWFSARATAMRDGTDRVVEWLGTSTDIHALRQLQERQGVLVAELQHRTRNLIGVVRSLAERTIDDAASMDDFEEQFGHRLAALSRVQGLLSHLSAGQRVAFDELLRSELAALGAIDRDGRGDRVVLDGPADVQLRSATVQTFALALHELATNAVKYGALSASNPDGHLTVCWHVETDDGAGQPSLHVEWRESEVVMPHVGAPAHGGGYGRELIERALPYQLGARTSYEMGVDGVHCMIAVPVEESEKRSLEE